MAKDFIAEMLGKTDFQPVCEAGDDLEAAANGQAVSSSHQSTDAMTHAGGAQSTTINDDHPENSWSETHQVPGTQNTVTHNYQRVAMNLQNTMNHGFRVDENGNYGNGNNLQNLPGEQQLTSIVGNDPDNGVYKNDKYSVLGPKEVDGAGTPSFSDIVQKDAKGTRIMMLQGTMQNPNLTNELDNTTIFINNTAIADDVHQAYIGDCYFLSALLQVIHYEPSKIINMMSLMGNNVSTTFYHKENDRWVPTVINTTLEFIKRDGTFMGAMARIANDAKMSKWDASIGGSTLKINKTQYYEAALWVNCMEQAFSIFAKQYGQYGTGVDPSKATGRFERIENGNSSCCLHLFYGDQASDYGAAATVDPTTGFDIVKENAMVIQSLLDLAKAQDGTADRDYHMMAITQPDKAAERLLSYTSILQEELYKAVAADPDNEELAASLITLGYIQRNTQKYYDEGFVAGREGTSSESQNDIRHALDDASLTLEKNESFQNASLPSYERFKKCLATVTSLTGRNTGKEGDNIFIYTCHCYNVDSVNLVGKDGKSLNSSTLADVLDNVDIVNSTVKMQNPHGTTKETIHTAPTRTAQGDFDVTLEDFLATIQIVTTATAENTRKK